MTIINFQYCEKTLIIELFGLITQISDNITTSIKKTEKKD